MLGERVLYFDTDSVIFTQRAGEIMPRTGDFLGDLTDKLVDYGSGAYISEFVSGGPRNYAYKIKMSDESEISICKVKGIRLNYVNSQKINFDVIQKLVYDGQIDNKNTVSIYNNMILRRADNIIYSTIREYNYKVNVTKRRRFAKIR